MLSESERTATAYTLLQHSNLSQLHFFASVTQQIIRAIEGQCMSRTCHILALMGYV